MKIEELMQKSVATCTRDDSLEAAARLFWERDCGAVPVVDAGGVLVGMLTDRDACIAAYTRGERLAHVRVGDAMASRVFSCWPDDSTEVVLELMVEHRVRRVPVVDAERKLVGVVSLCDLARAAGKEPRAAIRERRLARIGAALAEISRPHCELAEAPDSEFVPMKRTAAPPVPVGSSVD